MIGEAKVSQMSSAMTRGQSCTAVYLLSLSEEERWVSYQQSKSALMRRDSQVCRFQRDMQLHMQPTFNLFALSFLEGFDERLQVRSLALGNLLPHT
jgi:hypothetical protein